MNSGAKLNLDDLLSGFGESRSAIAQDIKSNLRQVLEESALDAQESALALLAVATSVGSKPLVAFARQSLIELRVPVNQIEEAVESAALMAMLNTYYRFRNLVSQGEPEAAERYKISGLKMRSIARPVLGKLRFEMLAFTLSVLNGCGSCIKLHEKNLRDAGVGVEKIHDLAKLASVVKAHQTLTI